MTIRYASSVLRDFPDLATGVLNVERISASAETPTTVARLQAMASQRLAGASEGELPEVQAWRRAFASMGLKPTQHRCASEALLRRLRKNGALPSLHPLVDLCNAVSVAFAIPVAAFDLARVAGGLEVRHATGTETYETFGGEVERPEPGEVIFADERGYAHARRWTNRQSGRSAVREGTASALIVAEALHADAHADVARLLATLRAGLAEAWPDALVVEVALETDARP